MKISAKWAFNGLDSVVANVESRVSVVVRKTAFDIEAGAKGRTPVDTGLLRSSIHVIVYNGSGYGDAVEAALAVFKAKYPTRKLPEFLPEEPKPQSKLSALVAVAASYGWFIENGTSRQPAQPFFLAAVTAVTDPFIAAVKAAIAQGIKDSSR